MSQAAMKITANNKAKERRTASVTAVFIFSMVSREIGKIVTVITLLNSYDGLRESHVFPQRQLTNALAGRRKNGVRKRWRGGWRTRFADTSYLFDIL